MAAAVRRSRQHAVMTAAAVPVLLVAVLLSVTPLTLAAVRTANSRRPDLLPSDCGRRLVQPENVGRPFIVGSGNTTAHYGQFPWQARVEVYDAEARGYVHQCGGIVITRQHVLTAAHCVDFVALRSIQVRVGDLRFSGRDSAEQEFAVASYRLHNQFGHGSSFTNDIVLLRLRPRGGQGIQLGTYVQPACLPEADTEYEPFLECEVSGWGKTSDGAPISEALRWVQVPLVSDDFCAAPEVYRDRFAAGRMFCAGLIGGGADSCGGDSGGPLACRDPATDRFVAYGIVSNGDPLGCGRRPGLYTKLSAYVDWLLRRLQLDLDEDTKVAVRPTTTVPTGTRAAECGRTSFSPPGDVGAAYAENAADFPWLVGIRRGAGVVCGGAVVSDRWIVTGATCAPEGAKLTARAGLLNVRDSSAPHLDFDIVRAVIHPHFAPPNNVSHDIALLKTATRISFSDSLRPICLPDPSRSSVLLAGQNVIFAGWGAPTQGGDHGLLKWARMKVIDTNTCRQNYASIRSGSLYFGVGTFCTRFEQITGPFKCGVNVGDQGSVLMEVVNEDGVDRWYAVGLPVAGVGCGHASLHDINISLRQSTDWILSVTSAS